MDSFGVVAFPKYTAARNNRSSHSDHEKVIKKRIEEGRVGQIPYLLPRPSSYAISKLILRSLDSVLPKRHLVCFEAFSWISVCLFLFGKFLNRWSATRKRIDLFFSGGFVVKMPIWGVGLTPWLRTKVVDPLTQIIRRGAEPKQLAFSTALGVTLGVFPICGTTVFLCGVAIGLIGNRCHAPSVMLANFLATPIELSLVVPFLRLGEVISGGPHFPLTSDALMKVVTGEATRDVLISVLHALLGWAVAAPFILGALYAVFVPCFKFLVHRFNAAPSSPKKQRAI